MIQTGLFFILGLLTASFVALLLAPLVWRKAQRLAFREYRAEIPASAREIRAEIDAVRAEAAVEIRRQDVLAAKIREKAARERAEAGRVLSENGELRARLRLVDDRVALLEDEVAQERERLRLAAEDIARLEDALAAARSEADAEAEERAILTERYRDLAALADEREAALEAMRTRKERSGSLFTARSEADAPARRALPDRGTFSRAGADARLKERVSAVVRRDVPQGAATPASKPEAGPAAALASLKADLSARDMTAAELAENGIRARIDDIAAHVVRLTAEREGTASPVRKILDGQEGDGGSALADRIRGGR
ncbi:hypothetical protein [Antarcticirhabdus aurantiaca]|uniref:Uncharacterized protein n=1 Tax=Antarcticirhabdus aurantiaca TaxID=2606717 RepID=A0ACD4NJQ1_9HYPH|nr:hypothetical protein [Antarcticirhabdus aurantiaca]WAJ27038.1 hypothetical protein OXU80_19525 [Jeongeuplla avenae]